MNPVDLLVGQVRRAVRESGRAQVVLAADLGISQKHMSMFMQDRADMSLALLRDLCELVGMDWYDVTPSGDGEEKSSRGEHVRVP